MNAPPSRPYVRDNPARSRYEIYDGEQLAGFTTYRLDGRRISFLHTEVASEFGHRGLARQLVAAELEEAGLHELAVLPFCPFVRNLILQKPDLYLDLVPDAERDRFGLPRTAPPPSSPGARSVSE